MQLDDKHMARLWDMLDAARTAVEFTEGVGFEDFLRDRKTRNAVERNLEIIGEAARCVSREIRESLSEILWTIVHNKLPPLIVRLEAIGVDSPPPVEE